MEEGQPFLEKLRSLRQLIADAPVASYKRDDLTLTLLRGEASRNNEDYQGICSVKLARRGRTSLKGATIDARLDKQVIEDDYMLRMIKHKPRNLDQQRDLSFSNLRASLPQVSTKNSLARPIDVGVSP